MRSKRKDEHVKLALKQGDYDNDFNKVRYIHNSFPNCNFSDVKLDAHYLNQDFEAPVYINAMTGGSESTRIINGNLAKMAKRFNLAMSVGSQHVALDNPEYESSFSIVRDVNPDGFVIGNVSANATVEEAQRAIAMIDANALGIHINIAQEITMDEGDREFSHWLEHIRAIVEGVDVPVIVKEVGFGMSHDTVQQIIDCGVQHVDVSGRGGTNFVWIENERSQDKRYEYLADWGITPVESLLMTRDLHQYIEVLASGGVKTPLDVVKLLTLGAKGVGISGQFLKFSQLPEDEMMEECGKFLEDIRKCMILIGVTRVDQLPTVNYELKESLGKYHEAK